MVAGEEHDLTDVVGVVTELALDRLGDAVRLAADRDGLLEIGGGERFERRVEGGPAVIPERALPAMCLTRAATLLESASRP